MAKTELKINEHDLRAAIGATKKLLNGVPLNTSDMKAVADIYEMLGMLQKMLPKGVIL